MLSLISDNNAVFGMPAYESYSFLFLNDFRSLDDVRMNLEVLKYCATVLFLVIFLFWVSLLYG